MARYLDGLTMAQIRMMHDCVNNNGFDRYNMGGYPMEYYDHSNNVMCAKCATKHVRDYVASMVLLALYDQSFMDEAQRQFEDSAAYEALDHHIDLFPDWQYTYANGEWLDHDGFPETLYCNEDLSDPDFDDPNDDDYRHPSICEECNESIE